MKLSKKRINKLQNKQAIKMGKAKPEQIIEETTLSGKSKYSRNGKYLRIKTRIENTNRYKTAYKKIEGLTKAKVEQIKPIIATAEKNKIKVKYNSLGLERKNYQTEGKQKLREITRQTRKQLNQVKERTPTRIKEKFEEKKKILVSGKINSMTKTTQEIEKNYKEAYKELLKGMLTKMGKTKMKEIIQNPDIIKKNLFYDIELWETIGKTKKRGLIAVGTDNNKTLQEVIEKIKKVESYQVGKTDKYIGYISSNEEGLKEIEERIKPNGEFTLVSQDGGAVKEIRITIRISEA